MLNGQDGEEKPQGKECRRKQMLLDMICTGPHLAWPGTQVQGQGGMALPGLWAWEDPYGLGSHTPSLLWPKGEGLRGRCGSPEARAGCHGTEHGERKARSRGPRTRAAQWPVPRASCRHWNAFHLALNRNFYFQKEKCWFEQAWPPRRPSGAGTRPPPALSGHRPAMLFQGLVQADSRWEHGK